MERRLAAVLAADLVGYSDLVGRNEVATIQSLGELFGAFERVLTKHNGRIVKTMGDGFLAEFGSVVNSVTCAKKLQQFATDHNKRRPADQQFVFRMGVHMGDVIVEGDDILGDGVNIAARLESFANPGCVAISARVHDEISGRLDLEFRDLGSKKFKNIARPVHVYEFVGNAELSVSPRTEVNERTAIAVLPFDNMSNDAHQDYFSDGISEDIITDLSKISALFVIARNSSFSYRGKAVNIQIVARELGVRYVVEGSVRKAGNRARVTAQLIDAKTGGHVWAERYDRELVDIFAVQDEITSEIVDALQLVLVSKETGAGSRPRPPDFKAYDFYLKGRKNFHAHLKINFIEARKLFKRAIECDANFARAYCGLADCELMIYSQYDGDKCNLDDAMQAVDKALELEPNLAEAHASKGLALSRRGENNRATEEFKKAILLDSDLYQAQYFWARFCWEQSNFSEAASHFEQAWRISPRDPQAPFLLMAVYGQLGKEKDVQIAAQATLELASKKLEQDSGDSRACFQCAHANAHLGRHSDAEHMIVRAVELDPLDRIVVYNAACMYATIGKLDQALDALESMPGENDQMLDWIMNDGDLDSLRGHPRFKKYIKLLRSKLKLMS